MAEPKKRRKGRGGAAAPRGGVRGEGDLAESAGSVARRWQEYAATKLRRAEWEVLFTHGRSSPAVWSCGTPARRRITTSSTLTSVSSSGVSWGANTEWFRIRCEPKERRRDPPGSSSAATSTLRMTTATGLIDNADETRRWFESARCWWPARLAPGRS